MNNTEKLLLKHEGYRQFPYKCSAGKLTIGIGRNIEEVGITEAEAIFLLRNDIDNCVKDLVQNFHWFADLSLVRQDALVNMCFNLGITNLKKFTRMLKALSESNFNEAAKEALDSKWAKQVGRRANDIVYMFKENKYP